MELPHAADADKLLRMTRWAVDSEPPLLDIRDLRVSFGGERGLWRGASRFRAVDGVSLGLERGSTLGIVGESGSGKSTLARAIVGLAETESGTVRFDGIDVLAARGAPKRRLQREIQLVFQDTSGSLNPRMRVGGIVTEPLRIHRAIGRREARSKAAELLALVGLDPAAAGRYPHQFSGGQRQRLSIARALATNPEFLVCDEPTSALDVSVQAQVLNLMKDLQRELGLTYLFISHNLAVVRHISDRVGVMYLGKIVELSPKRTIFTAPKHPYTRMLLDAIPDLEMTGRARTPVAGEVPNPLNPPAGCTFHPRCPQVNERCKREVPELKPILVGGEEVRVACHAVEEGRI
jgi:peptide/nickel transport system ATP-binding protein